MGELQQQPSVRTIRRRIVLTFLLFSSGIFLTFAAYSSLVYLQSSINIEGGVGAASITATYVTAAIFGITFTPVLMRVFGAKISVIISQITYLFFVLVNIHPEAYLLIPAGAIAGIGEATMWPSMMLFCSHYGKCFARYGSKDTRFYVVEFIGYFYFIFHTNQLTGNLVSYAIFYAGKKIEVTYNATASPYGSSVAVWDNGKPTRDLTVCGANDCQDPNVTQQNIDQYEPATEATLYTMIGVMGGMILCAIAINTLFIKNIDTSLEVEDDQNPNKQTPGSPNNAKEAFYLGLDTMKKTLLHLINPRQLLITPFALYSGLLMSYGFGELTRAFGSCMLGVDQVGLCMAGYSAADAIMSFVTGKVSSRYGRNAMLIIGLMLDITNYMIALFWIPTASSLWVVYVLFAIVGGVDGVWQPLVNEMHASYFPATQDIAFTVWNLWTLVGIAIQFGWSTSVCVREKIYIQMGLLAFSIGAYYFGEYYYKEEAKEVDESEQEKTEYCFSITAL